MPDLKLIALDAEDLGVISAHLQDAVLRVGDMVYLPNEKRFVALANRFDWAKAKNAAVKRRGRHRQTALSVVAPDYVLSVLTVQKCKASILRIRRRRWRFLAVTFEPASSQNETPEGDVTLTFSGGAAIRLSVECIEAELKDLGAAWTAKRSPEHPEDAS